MQEGHFRTTMSEETPPLSRTLLSRAFQAAVHDARVTTATFAYGYGTPDQIGLSGPNTTFFAQMDNTTLERWIALLFGTVQMGGGRIPAAIVHWDCLAPCILRVLLWFVRVEAVTRCTAAVRTNPQLMTTKCPSFVDNIRAAAIADDVESGSLPRFATDRVRASTTSPAGGCVREVAYFKGPILRLLQADLIGPRPQHHETLCLPALAFAPIVHDALSPIQRHQGWYTMCCPELWHTSHAKGRLFSAVNDPAVYDDTGDAVNDEDAVDAHTLEVWHRVADKIVKDCPQMEVLLRRAVGKLIADEERLIRDGRKSLVAFLSEHPAYDFLFWSPDTVANRTCYGDELVAAVVAFQDEDE